MAVAPKPPPGPRKLPDGRYETRYPGITTTIPMPEWALELQCWNDRLPTGYDAYYHFKRASELMYPESIWHPWREDRMRAFCDDSLATKINGVTIRSFAWVGCGAAGKTACSGLIAMNYFMVNPKDTSVTLTSTTKDAIRQRVWPVIQSLFYSAMETCFRPSNVEPFHMVNSKAMLQWKKGDDKHSIFALAVKDGETAKAIENLKGRHTKRMMLIVDEAAGTPEAILETIPNMFKGTTELCLFFLANGPITKMDGFSSICEPADGWGSIGPSTGFWHTKGVPKWQIPPSLCLHFSGAESPNVKAAKTIYPFLYSYENWLKVKDEPEVQRTVQYWSQDLGFWPPETFALTVLTMSLIEATGAKDRVKFMSRRTPVGSMDPGFGGDDCILLLGAIGDTEDGEVLQIERRVKVPILVDAKDEKGRPMDAEHQIAKAVIRYCSAHGVTPENFAIEATGTGRGAASVVSAEWGEIVRVESGGSPSSMPASTDDPRQAHKVYINKITELWFSIREYVSTGQLKGLYEEAIRDLCTRLEVEASKSKKVKLENKDDYKARMGGHSPNDGDAVAMLVELAKRRGLKQSNKAVTATDRTWNEFVRKAAEVTDEPSIYEQTPFGWGRREDVLEDVFT